MGERSTSTDDTVQAFECTRCGERVESATGTCSTPLCDGDVRRVGVGRE
jgi:Zn finger protein HypA/HybF involved in hydrogenase expression